MEDSNIQKRTKRLLYLDGIKGISCLFIFFHHFMLKYFPASYYGTKDSGQLSNLEYLLSQTPLGIVVNGNFFVHIFIQISAYVITYQILNMDYRKTGYFMFKRYLKLVFPLSVTAIIIFLQHLPVLISEGKLAVLNEIIKFGTSLIFGVLFQGNTDISTGMWMLNFFFLGGIIVSVIASACWILDGRKIIIVPLVAMLCLFFSPSITNLHYATVFAGCTLCLFNSYFDFQIHIIFVPVLLFITIITGSFPTGFIPENLYRYMIIPYVKNKFMVSFYWHLTAAFLLILTILKIKILQNFLAKKPFIFLSKISLWVYLLHGFAIRYTEIFVNLFNLPDSNLKVLINLVISSIMLLTASFAFSKFITPAGNNIIEKLTDKMSKNIEQD